MEFRQEQLVEREIENAGYLKLGLSLKQIAEVTGLSKKLLVAHVRNMMQKLKSENMVALIKTLKE